MTTINSQTDPPESNAFDYYQNMWNDANSYLPAIQGPLNHQNDQTQAAVSMVTPAQPTQSVHISYCTEQQDNLQMQFAQQLTGDLAAMQIQYANSILPCGGARGRGPRRQSARSLMKNREAAREYRKRRKAYVQGLEKHVADLEDQNKVLMEEMKIWKEMCHHDSA
ncbi:cyclic AMP-responsive element-binding protein 1-like [Festucalex cinctus]